VGGDTFDLCGLYGSGSGGADGIEFAISDAGGDGAGGEDAGADKVAPVEIDCQRGDLVWMDFVRDFQRFQLNRNGAVAKRLKPFVQRVSDPGIPSAAQRRLPTIEWR